MLFCKRCGGIVVPQEGSLVCKGCGHTITNKESKFEVATRLEKKEKVTTFVDTSTEILPTIKVYCEKCGNMKATYRLEQTRAADEPSTRFFTCTKCKHTWAEYT
jgi:DNA-directed RNA polymerase subunit M